MSHTEDFISKFNLDTDSFNEQGEIIKQTFEPETYQVFVPEVNKELSLIELAQKLETRDIENKFSVFIRATISFLRSFESRFQTKKEQAKLIIINQLNNVEKVANQCKNEEDKIMKTFNEMKEEIEGLKAMIEKEQNEKERLLNHNDRLISMLERNKAPKNKKEEKPTPKWEQG